MGKIDMVVLTLESDATLISRVRSVDWTGRTFTAVGETIVFSRREIFKTLNTLLVKATLQTLTRKKMVSFSIDTFIHVLFSLKIRQTLHHPSHEPSEGFPHSRKISPNSKLLSCQSDKNSEMPLKATASESKGSPPKFSVGMDTCLSP